jgi:hypothetical protein
MTTTTSNLALTKPTVGADADAWGGELNADLDLIDNEWAVTTRGDAAYAIAGSDRVIVITAPFTAGRTFTLPAAAAFKPSQPLIILDSVAAISPASPLVLARQGADTIVAPAGAALTSHTISRPRQTITLRSNGADRWIVQAGFDFETGTWTPAPTFSTPGDLAITGVTASGTYTRIGDLVFLDFALGFTPTWTTASGVFEIGGIPFPFANVGSAAGTVRSLNAPFTWPTGLTYVALYAADTTHLGVRATGSTLGTSQFQTVHLTSGVAHNMNGSIIYKAT